MSNWISLLENPPDKDCNICVKVGDNYETYKFKRFSFNGWSIYKFVDPIEVSHILEEAVYIILDEIK